MENGLTWHTVSCLLLGANEPGGEGEKEEEEEEIKKKEKKEENKEEKKDEEEKEALIVLYIDPGKEYSRTIPSPWGTLQILIVILMWPHPIPQES